jgi:uncharacterized repeat protein (TIGR01451 family)
MLLSKFARGVHKVAKLVTKSPIRTGLFGMLAGTVLLAGLLLSPLTRADNVVFNSTRDCDSNAVMYCGAMNLGELNNKYDNNASTRHIYDYFDITGKDINNMRQYAKAGKVHKNGNVTVNGKVVATGAVTAGRSYIPGSTHRNHMGTSFYTRSPSVSFLSDSLDSFVVMEGGAFSYAIIASCGNPVEAKAVAHPNYQLEKVVREQGGNWRENVRINYGQTVEFRVIVKSTGNAPVRNLHVRDRLPAGLTYVAGSLTRDGDPANATNFFGDGIRIARLPAGDKVTFRFKATTNPVTQPEDCKEKTITNKSFTTANNLPNKNDTASVTLVCKRIDQPEYKIVKQVQRIGEKRWHEDITVPNGTTVRYRVVITNTGNVAIKNLVASDTLPAHVTYVNNTLRRDGKIVTNDNDFFAAGINIGTLNKSTSTTFLFNAVIGSSDPSVPCESGVLRNIAHADADALEPISDDANVNRECQSVSYSCDLLTVTSLGSRNFRFSVFYSAAPGVTLSSVGYNFGDNTPEFVTNNLTTTHQYAVDGTYTAFVNLTFNVQGEMHTVSSEGCRYTLSSTTPPDNCPIPGKEHLPADSPECAEDEEIIVPGEVPNTGPGSLLGLFAGSSILGTLGYRKWTLRRQKQ